MDIDDEVARLKGILIAACAFLVSGYFSYGEMKFAIWGKTADATISRTHETRSTGRSSRPLLAVEYQFKEADGTGRSERDDVAIDWPVPASNTVTVEYLPGVADSSRIVGHSNTFMVYVFVGCLAWLGYSGFKLWKEANEAVHGSGRRRRK